MKKIVVSLMMFMILIPARCVLAIDLAATPNQLSPSLQNLIRNNLNAQVNLGATEPSPGIFSWSPAPVSPSNPVDSFWFDSSGNLELSGGLSANGKAVASEFCLGSSCVSTWPVGSGQYFPAGTGLVSVAGGDAYGPVYNSSNPFPANFMIPGAQVDSSDNLILSNSIYAQNSTSMPDATGLLISNLAGNNAGIQASFISLTLIDSTGAKTQTIGTISSNPVALSAIGTNVGPGGIDSGSLSPNTFYYIWVIGNGTQLNLVFSLSNVWANVVKTNLYGYVFGHLIGCALTNSSSQFIGFHQYGNEFRYNVPQMLALPTPTPLTPVQSPSVTPVGASGNTSYGYGVIAVGQNGGWTTCVPTLIGTGNAELTSTNYNTISWNSVSGASSYVVFRTTSGGTDGLGNLLGTGIIGMGITGTSFNDTGISSTSANLPSSNTAASFAEYLLPLIPPLAIEALYAVNNLQATSDDGSLVLSADGTNAYFSLTIPSGDPSTTKQFCVPFLVPGSLWETYLNLPASSLELMGFKLNL